MSSTPELPSLLASHHKKRERESARALKYSSKKWGKVAPAYHRLSTVTSCEYPMYVMSVNELFNMTELLPHQLLLRHGKLHKYSEDMFGRIIFVSHEWSGSDRPDPTNKQLEALQGLMKRLISGEEDNVQSNWKTQLIFQENIRVRADEWKAALPHSYVWIDYCSMPQPTAGAMPTESEVKLASCMDRAAVMRALDRFSMRMDMRTAMENSPPTADADHRHDGDDLSVALSAAVRSIPSYVERTTVMLVLVPALEHADDKERFCDFSSWRGRGWCRMEFMCALLARNEIPTLVFKGGASTPNFVVPIDAFHLAPGRGHFTCCAKNHDFGQGPGTVPCDKHKVRSVLETMINAKTKSLHERGDVFAARCFSVRKRWFLRGLPTPLFLGYKGARKKSTPPQMVGLSQLKLLLRWKDDETEAARAKIFGVGLVFWAAMAGDARALKEALAALPAEQRRTAINRCVVQDWQQCFLLRGYSALHAAMSFGNWEVVEQLLDAGARSDARSFGFGSASLDALHWAALFGRAENIKSWLRRFPDWELNRGNYLGQAISHGPDKLECVLALLEAGADPTCLSRGGTSVLMFAALNPDSGEEIIRALLRIPEIASAIDLSQTPQRFSFTMRFRNTMVRLAYRFGNRNGVVVGRVVGGEGATALHNAAMIGNIRVVRVLVDAGADISTRNAAGYSALDTAATIFGGGREENVPTELCALLGGSSEACLSGRFSLRKMVSEKLSLRLKQPTGSLSSVTE